MSETIKEVKEITEQLERIANYLEEIVKLNKHHWLRKNNPPKNSLW